MSILFDDQTKALYTAEDFVDREQFLALIESKISQRQQEHEAITYPLLNFWGVAGSGKTWLLQHSTAVWNRNNAPSQATFTAYIDMQTIDASHPKKTERLVELIASQLLEQLTPDDGRQQQLEKAIIGKELSLLLSILQSLAADHTPILLFDHLSWADPEWWEQMEADMLEPLLTTNRIIVITATRHPLLSWLRPELLRRQETLQLTHLAPLWAADLQRVTGETGAPYNNWRYSGGNPWLGTQLAMAYSPFTEQDLLSTYRHFTDVLFTSIPRNLVLYLETIGLLRSFREAALSHMLKRTGHLVPNKVKLGRILRQLAQNGDIVWWDRENARYVSSVTARIILTQQQFIHNKEQLLKTQREAIEFYWQRLSTYNDHRAIIEIIYHQAWLIMGGQKATRAGELWDHINSLEGTVHKQVKESFLADDELKSLLSSEQYQQFITHFEESAA